jgi:hypothetical protein
MPKDRQIPMKAEVESIDFKNCPRVSKTDLFYDEGVRSAANYAENELLEMLQSRDMFDVYEALGALSKRKLISALPVLQHIAVFDEDIGIKEEAMRTIMRIGGKKAKEILRLLKTPENKDFMEEELE